MSELEDVDPTPTTVAELLGLFKLHARGRWDVWQVIHDGRLVYFGRRLYHPNKMRMDTRMVMPHGKTACCLRCGNGQSFRWAPAEPTAYEPLRWITLCPLCLGFYVGLWPEIFPRLRLGVRTSAGSDHRWIAEKFGHRAIFKLDEALWFRLPPFANDQPSPWAQTQLHIGR